MPLARRLSSLLFASAVLAGLLVDSRSATAQSVAVEPAVSVRVTVVADGRSRMILGDLVEYDVEGLALQVKGEIVRLAWVDLTTHSAFTARRRVMDESDPQDWLGLAEFGRAIGAEREAEQALLRALRLDASLAEEAARVRALPANSLRPEPEQEEEEPEEGPDLLVEAVEVARYLPVTPEQAQAAIAAADREADRGLTSLGVTARRLETSHFLIYTDWPPGDDAFLVNALEEAYRLVAYEFGVPVEENIFVGKLPVYMFASHTTFMRYAREIDGQEGFRITVAGYYSGRRNGMGKLVMSTPVNTREIGLDAARRIWRRTLTHEFTHAFIARYRSNAFVPRWLNEGIAEVIAEQVHPRQGAIDTARSIARGSRSIVSIFDDRVIPGPEMYPVMMSIVQGLQQEDPQRFVRFVDRIKAGEEAEAVLQEMYGLDYAGLEKAWRAYMMRR